MKTTFSYKNTAKRAITALTAAAVMTTTFAGFTASADDPAAVRDDSFTVTYNGHEVIRNNYTLDSVKTGFTYTDSFFESDPRSYDPSLATMSCVMGDASTNYSKDGDYKDGAHTITDVLNKIGFTDIFVNDGYTQKPTKDSVGCVIASRKTLIGGKASYIVSVTVRSSDYEKEWISNVTLGRSGEANGFSAASAKVKKHIEDYISSHAEIRKAAAEGRAVMWFQGFSRGGAITNLTAKRFIDEHPDIPVFAYCIAAPQGGIKSEERSDRDYRSIHNVINTNDIVPYVAPSAMGFKRYGVDHYVNDESINEQLLLNGKFFVNNLSDNNGYVQATEKRLELVRKHIRNAAGSKADLCMPYSVQNKRISIGLHIPSIENASVSLPTYRVISNFFNNITQSVTREVYVQSGLQDALGRFMDLLFSGADLASLKDKLKNNTIVSDMVKFYFLKRVTSVNPVTFLAPSIAIAQILMINIDDLISAAKSALSLNPVIKETLKSYTNGPDQALKDIGLIAKYGFKGFKDLDEIATFVSNVGDISHNHTPKQYIGWLRSYDPWYEGSAVKAEHIDGDKLSVSDAKDKRAA